MRREGKREFGVYTPPSGEDSIRQSNLLGIESTSKINNIQLGSRSELRDPNQGSVERSNQIGIELVNRMNNIGKRFEEMISQGWGGNVAER